jgi:glc operon protein GlcG
MNSKKYLTAADVKIIAAGSEAEASKNSWKVCIAIVDDGGHPLGFQRLDGCGAASAAIAQSKAYSAAMRRRATHLDEELVKNGRVSMLSMPNIIFLEGGVPIVVEGEVIGAVGVSGVKSAEDAQIAQAGIDALLK